MEFGDFARSGRYYTVIEDRPKVLAFMLSWFVSEWEIGEPMMKIHQAE